MKKILFLYGLFISIMLNTSAHALPCVLPDGTVWGQVIKSRLGGNASKGYVSESYVEGHKESKVGQTPDGINIRCNYNTGKFFLQNDPQTALSIEQVSNYLGIEKNDEEYEHGLAVAKLIADTEKSNAEQKAKKEKEYNERCTLPDGSYLLGGERRTVGPRAEVVCSNGKLGYVNIGERIAKKISPEEACQYMPEYCPEQQSHPEPQQQPVTATSTEPAQTTPSDAGKAEQPQSVVTTSTETTPSGSSATTSTGTTPSGSAATTSTETTPSGSAATTSTETTPSGSSATTSTETTPSGSAATTSTGTTPSGSSATTSAETTPSGSSATTSTETTPSGSSATTSTETTPSGSSATTSTETTPSDSIAATPAESTQTTPPDAGKILDDKTESGKKTDLSNQSVTGSTKQPTIDSTAAMQNEKGKTTSGNVEKSSFFGASNLGDDYGMGNCAGGNIFQQLACRAGVIGSGLKSVAYMIAGFGLIVFSFAAIFGKVKWPLFATIMFSCFLLSATVFVINMMTDKGDASWIGGIKGNGSDYYSDNVTNVPATDSGGVPDGESPK